MTKTKNKKQYLSIALIATGVLVISTTPIAKELIQFLLTRDCPIIGSRGVRECGLAKGLENADYIVGFMLLWLFIGGVLLTIGSVKYFNIKKKS